jgi:membrane-associated HD superfamily phosphohydrolase
MTQLRERSGSATRPMPDEAVVSGLEHTGGGLPTTLRTIGAISVLVVGAVHLQQYLSYPAVPVIGPLFVLNFAGATVIGLGLLIPESRMRLLHTLLALGGIGLSATSIVFLFISEHQPLFGFHEHGYRAAIVIALAAEAVALLTLVAYLVTRARGRA